MEHGRDVAADVVAVEADVQRAHRRADALDLLDLVGEHRREDRSPAHDADDADALGSLIALDDLVGDAGEGAAHRLLVHDLGLEPGLFHGTPFNKKRCPDRLRAAQDIQLVYGRPSWLRGVSPCWSLVPRLKVL